MANTIVSRIPPGFVKSKLEGKTAELALLRMNEGSEGEYLPTIEINLGTVQLLNKDGEPGRKKIMEASVSIPVQCHSEQACVNALCEPSRRDLPANVAMPKMPANSASFQTVNVRLQQSLVKMTNWRIAVIMSLMGGYVLPSSVTDDEIKEVGIKSGLLQPTTPNAHDDADNVNRGNAVTV